RVGLGTSVLVASQYHPLWLANATASLDALSGGRLTLGVGVGWSAAEFAALGQDFRTRGRRTDEILEILRICWTTDPSSFHGEHSHPRGKRGGPPACQRLGLEPGNVRAPLAPLRRDHPDPATFTIALRTGWDPQGMDRDEIAREREGFEAAGVQHVVAAPSRTDLDSWLRSMDLLAGILGLEGAPA